MPKNNLQSGQALLLATTLFVLAATLILGGFMAPIVRTAKSGQDLLAGDRSYFLSESGAEDVAYRLKNNVTVSSSETLTLSGQSVTTNITTVSGGKTIDSSANWQNRIRNLQLKLSAGIGAAFNYGIQVGNGGFILNGGSQVNGNVYANGTITATNGVHITGSAIAANSAALSADQANNLPGTPASSITFGNASASEDFAQSFQVSTTGPANKVQFYIKKSGAPSDETVRLTSDNSGAPNSSALTTGTLSASLVTTSYGWVEVVFADNPQLVAGTTYWLVIDGGSNASKYYIIGANSNGYPNGLGKIGRYSTGVWNNTSPSGLDGYFQLYLGGLTSSLGGDSYVGGVCVGYTSGCSGVGSGDAWAHTITGAKVSGHLYCQTGSNNSPSSCDTSRPDPAPQPMPISDANVQEWKAEAQAGTTITGDYHVNYLNATTGPAYITGNLLVDGGGTLTLSGTVYVKGTITVSGGGKIKLAATYGGNSGTILSDGWINLAGGGSLTGSGQTGSYLLILTTSDCPSGASCSGNNAMSVTGGAGAVILNAQNGTMYLSGGVSAKEATAYQLTAAGGTTITYDSGLANVNFSSGPSGGWDIGGWSETP